MVKRRVLIQQIKMKLKKKLNNIIAEQVKSVLFESAIKDDIRHLLQKKYAEILPYSIIKGGAVAASTHTLKNSMPAVQIDSKLKPTGVLLVVGDTGGPHIIIKSIVNNKETGLQGYGSKMMNVIFDTIDIIAQKYDLSPKDITININQDVSGGYWHKIIDKYGDNYTFIFS